MAYGAGILAWPVTVFAAIDETSTGLKTAATTAGIADFCSGTPRECLMTVIAGVINAVLGTMGIVFVILMLYAGFLWMTAGGDTKNVDKAKTLLKNAIVGVFILIGAFAISSFVLGSLSGAVGTK